VAVFGPAGDGAGGGHSTAPLTIAAAAVSTSRGAVLYDETYRGYHGEYCQGAWQWLPRYNLGLIVETPVQENASGLSRTWPWAGLASLFAIAVASGITFWHHRQVTTLTNARQPLGRYEIARELGSGGMGVVYLAKHKELGRDIALKVLRGDRQDEDDRMRFDREAKLAASLSCPHSVSVYDFGYTERGDAYCVMELLEGLTLAELVARGGAQPPGRVVWIMQQICQSMLEAHRKGLLHRDLKPQNVMLRFDTVVGDWATVFDFGLAKPIEPSLDMFQTAETIWAGTPMYMAPERFRDPTSMDPRSDIYSIGCIAYYLLAGNPPFVECDPESMFALIMSEHPINIATHRGSEIDEQLDKWVRDCMRKDKNTRAASIPELARSLQAISESMPWSRSDAEAWWMTHARELLR
jgi:serine/threonine protein kinase